MRMRNTYRKAFDEAKIRHAKLSKSLPPGTVTDELAALAKSAASACFNLAASMEMQWRMSRTSHDAASTQKLQGMLKESIQYYEYLEQNFLRRRISEMLNAKRAEDYAYFLRVQAKTRLRISNLPRIRDRPVRDKEEMARAYLARVEEKRADEQAAGRSVSNTVEMTPEMFAAIKDIVDRDVKHNETLESVVAFGLIAEMPGYETIVDFIPMEM